MNKIKIIYSAVVVMLMLSSTQMISHTVKSEGEDPPDVTVYGDKIWCVSHPIETNDDELFRVLLHNSETYDVNVDVYWWYETWEVYPTQYNLTVPAQSCTTWTDNASILWTGAWWQWKDVTVEIYLAGTSTLLCNLTKSFRAKRITFFYFNSYDNDGLPEQWSTFPANMANGFLDSHSSTATVGDIELLDGNSCTGTETGDITSVWLRVKGYYSTNKHTIKLRPVFPGGDGGEYEFDDISTSSAWSEWFEITDDSRAPATWTWTDVDTLECDVISEGDFSLFTLYCSQVEIRVCYTDDL
jgi:hypothetical protein